MSELVTVAIIAGAAPVVGFIVGTVGCAAIMGWLIKTGRIRS